MKKKGARDDARHTALPPGSFIPGGAALAEYVCKVIVAHQKQAWEPTKAIMDRNLQVIRDSHKQSSGEVTTRGCGLCGRLAAPTEAAGFASLCRKQDCMLRICKNCAVKGYCPTCVTRCSIAECNAVLAGYYGVCDGCKEQQCGKHRQFCPGCTGRICWDPQNPARGIECLEKHVCTREDADSIRRFHLDKIKSEK